MLLFKINVGTGLSPEDNFAPFFSSYMRISKPKGR